MPTGNSSRGILAFFAMLILAGACRPETPETIPWSPSLPLALESARKQGKPVFLYVTATWCGICRRVERESLEHSGTLSSMGGVVPVKVDIDQYAWIGQRYDVPAVPAFLLLDPHGRVMSRTFGFHSPEQIQALLMAAVIAEGVHD